MRGPSLEERIERLFRFLGGVRDEDRLSPAELLDWEPEIKRFERRARAAAGFLTLCCGWLLAWLLWRLAERLDGPPGAVAYSTRGILEWSGPGFLFTMAWLPGLIWLAARGRWPEHVERYRRYKATRPGFAIGRTLFVGCVLTTLLAAALAVVTWYSADVIGPRGIARRAGPVRLQSYADVTAIVRYEHLAGNGAAVAQPNLEIRFRSGPPLRLETSPRGLDEARLQTIAEYFSARAQRPIVREDTRP